MKRVFRQAGGWVSPVVLIDSRVAGVWEQDRRKGSLELTVQPFTRLSTPAKRQLSDEADSLGAFLEAAVRISFAR